MRESLYRDLDPEEIDLIKQFDALEKLEEDGRLLGTRFYSDKGINITPKESIKFVTAVTKEHLELLNRSEKIPVVISNPPTSLS